jgi:hypothetical protein
MIQKGMVQRAMALAVPTLGGDNTITRIAIATTFE